MRLYKLHLLNFQGVRDASFNFGGANANIYGDNAAGKTTVFNAVTWLLFGKASTGAKNYSPKTKGTDGDLHYLDHGVEAVFSLDDGEIITLRKVLKEDWKKKRGSTQEEFSGHVVDYYINGVPVKEKEYVTFIEHCIGKEEQVQMLMMPNYFPEILHWEQRRRILLEMCGNVSDEDVITESPHLGDLLEYLTIPGTVGKHYSVDEYKKIAAAQRSDINKKLQLIPARIDEAKKAIPDLTGLSSGPINAKIAALNSSIERLESERQEAMSDDATADTVRKEISAIKTKIAESRAAYAETNAKTNEAVLAEVSRLRTEQSHIRNTLSAKEARLASAQNNLTSLKNMNQKLKNELQRVRAAEWTGKDTCDACMRPLPEEDVVAARENFNKNKSQQLEAIKAEGGKTCSKEMIAAAEAKIEALKQEIEAEKTSAASFDALIAEAEKKVVTPPPFESTEAYTSAMEQISELESDATKASSTVANQLNLLNSKIAEKRREIDDLQAKKSKISLAEQQQARIDDLAAEEKHLSGEFENIERGVHLCEEFIKAKVSMLTERINSKFASVRFRLFVEQINGGIKEDCEVMIPGEYGQMVPYALANNAAKVNAGLEIINALATHWEKSVPVFADNAEGVTRLQEIDGQLIRLVVSAADKSLRLEVVGA
ncbi:MAG: AAA family ATPase [Defluviitaleaceae bacterium]|nr:AAA family ATPase [Defluviitaleaceae bacterium]